jgi:Flp pilus assembly pilin Flp
MKKIIAFLSDEAGQDMVEYALLAGFVAVAAGALLPPVANDISAIFSKLASVIADAP